MLPRFNNHFSHSLLEELEKMSSKSRDLKYFFSNIKSLRDTEDCEPNSILKEIFKMMKEPELLRVFTKISKKRFLNLVENLEN